MEPDPSTIRNFKDFLQLYNKMTELCFKRCVDNLNSRQLDPDETKCVEHCSQKFITYNNRLMHNFVKAQGEIMNRRVNEAEEQQHLLEQQKQNNLEDHHIAIDTINQEVIASNTS